MGALKVMARGKERTSEYSNTLQNVALLIPMLSGPYHHPIKVRDKVGLLYPIIKLA